MACQLFAALQSMCIITATLAAVARLCIQKQYIPSWYVFALAASQFGVYPWGFAATN
jgi:hypothetical protein